MSFNKGVTPFGVKTQNIRLFSRIQVKTFHKGFVFTLVRLDCQGKFSGMELVLKSACRLFAPAPTGYVFVNTFEKELISAGALTSDFFCDLLSVLWRFKRDLFRTIYF